MDARVKLTPHMLDYDTKFTDDGEVKWLPYFMYFHPNNHRSPVVNTDSSGFRYSERRGAKFSVADHAGVEPVRLMAGSSTAFGIGASADRWTLASCLSENDNRQEPWLNFSGRSFNSTQELLLMVLYQHLLPKVEEIVLFSGFNNLGLARMTPEKRLEHGAFFNCNEFFDKFKMTNSNISSIRKWVTDAKKSAKETENDAPSLEDQIHFAANLTLRHLNIWQILASNLGAKLTFVLQPLSGWVRSRGCAEEEALFKQLDKVGRFSDIYGDILQKEVCHEYALQLKNGATAMNVNFINLSPILSESIEPDQWLFVDRIHFTDQGHDFVSHKLLEII